MTSRVLVYGASWCRFTFGLRQYLLESRVDYEYFDIDNDPQAAAFVRTIGDGKLKYPVVVVDEETAVNPRFSELQQMLEMQDVVQRPRPAGSARRRLGDLDLEERRSA
jgi:mycoredoxin